MINLQKVIGLVLVVGLVGETEGEPAGKDRNEEPP